jgi:drug/metabolite transporter (DMT)-like permease
MKALAKHRQLAVFALLGLIWGSEWIATRELDGPPLRGQAIRYALAAIVLTGVIAGFRLQVPNWRSTVAAVVNGITMLALPSILTVWASQRISPGLLVLILAMTPLVAALMEGRASGVVLSSLIGGVAGTVLIASSALSFSLGQAGAAAAMLLAAISVAGSVVYAKRELSELRPVMMAAGLFWGGAVALGVASAVAESGIPMAWTEKSLFLTAIIAIFGDMFAFPLYYWLLNRKASFQVTASIWATTAVGTMESLVWLHAAPSLRISAGVVVILVSLGAIWRASADDEVLVAIEVTPRHSGD